VQTNLVFFSDLVNLTYDIITANREMKIAMKLRYNITKKRPLWTWVKITDC